MDNFAFLLSLISVLIVSIVSLVGIVSLILKREILNKITLLLVSLAVGTLFGDVFLHLIPETYEKINNSLKIGLLVVSGILLFFVLEKFLRWRHVHITGDSVKPVAFINIVGDGLHNFIDGVLISASYAVSIELGIATTITVLMHEIPQEIGDFGILIHSGFSPKKALLFNFASALSSFLGVFLVMWLSKSAEDLVYMLIPVTAGGFIYIAGSDLIPELHHKTDIKNSLLQFVFMIAGIVIMAVLALDH